jgi:hypothetical protein
MAGFQKIYKSGGRGTASWLVRINLAITKILENRFSKTTTSFFFAGTQQNKRFHMNILLRRSSSSSSPPSSSPMVVGITTTGSRSIQEPTPRRVWSRRTALAAAATPSPRASPKQFLDRVQFSLISPRSNASNETEMEENSPKTKSRSAVRILPRRKSMSAMIPSPTSAVTSAGKATRTRRQSLVNSIMNKSPKAPSQSISPSKTSTATAEPGMIATSRTARRNSLLCSNKVSKSPSTTVTSPSVEKVVATAGTAPRRQSNVSSNKNKIPTAVASMSASVTTPLSKRHGMTLRSTAKKQQPGQQAVTGGAKKVSTPTSFESKVRKSISFLTPPSDSKKSGSAAPTDAGSKKVYKKTPLPSKEKKALDSFGEQKSSETIPVIKDPTKIQGVRFDVATPPPPPPPRPQTKKTGSKAAAGSKKVYKKTPMPSRKKKTMNSHEEQKVCLPEPVLSDPTTIQHITDERFLLDTVKVQFGSETASKTSSDSLTQPVVAVVSDAVDIMEAASMMQPAMDEKDFTWAKLPVEVEEDEKEEEEELSLMEAAIALFPLLTRSDSASDEEEEQFLGAAAMNKEKATVVVTNKIVTPPKLKKKTQQETMITEDMTDEVPLLVASATETDLETIMPWSETADEEKLLATDEEMMSWKHVMSALVGAMVLTSSLAIATQHLSGVCLLA